jgi:amidase
MSELAFLPAHELARRIRRKQVSSQELLAMYLARIAQLGGPVNAVVVLDAERATARAQQADAALARGENWGPLHGVPMTVKESFNVGGLPTTYGHAAYAHNIAGSDAVTVQRLLGAGAVIFGKTNVPASLADWQSFNPVYGTTGNPWDVTRTPGGSSGGSAAALAAGFTALEMGSDIGASIRNPAHYCGVWGHKPTWGVVPQTGHELTPWATADFFDIAAVGPLARSAYDLSLAMDVLAAPLEMLTAMGRVPLAWRDRGMPPRRSRVAVLYDDPQAEVDVNVQQGLRNLVDFLRSEGVVVTEDARPVDSAESNDVYTHLLRAATGSHYTDEAYALAQDRAKGYAPDDQSYAARHFRGNTYSHLAWVRKDEQRERLRRQWARFFEQHDLLICPTATTPAFPHNQQGERWERMIPVNGHHQPSTDALFWAGYPGIVGLPATTIPLGLSQGGAVGGAQYPQGLPVGAQIIGPAFADPEVLRFAQFIETGYRAFVAPPASTGLSGR